MKPIFSHTKERKNYFHGCLEKYQYLSLIEFEGRTVRYGPRFFPIDFVGHKSMGKKNEVP